MTRAASEKLASSVPRTRGSSASSWVWYSLRSTLMPPRIEVRALEIRVNGRVEGVAHVRIVGDRAYQGHLAGGTRRDTLGDQLPGVGQQACGNTFVQTMAFQIACAVGDLHQLLGHVLLHLGLVHDNLGLD